LPLRPTVVVGSKNLQGAQAPGPVCSRPKGSMSLKFPCPRWPADTAVLRRRNFAALGTAGTSRHVASRLVARTRRAPQCLHTAEVAATSVKSLARRCVVSTARAFRLLAL